MKPSSMRLLLLATLFIPCLSYGQAQGGSQDSEKSAVVQQIMEKLNVNRLLEQQISSLVAMVKNQSTLIVAEAGVPAGQRDKAAKLFATEIDGIYSSLVGSSKSITVAAYTNAFSVEELRQLLAFYNTPLGNKLTTELPRLQAEGMKKANAEGQRYATQAICGAFKKFPANGIKGEVPEFCR